ERSRGVRKSACFVIAASFSQSDREAGCECVTGPGRIDGLHLEARQPMFAAGPKDQVASIIDLEGGHFEAGSKELLRGAPSGRIVADFKASEHFCFRAVGANDIERSEQSSGSRASRRRIEHDEGVGFV